jgi:hypothetical protein
MDISAGRLELGDECLEAFQKGSRRQVSGYCSASTAQMYLNQVLGNSLVPPHLFVVAASAYNHP